MVKPLAQIREIRLFVAFVISFVTDRSITRSLWTAQHPMVRDKSNMQWEFRPGLKLSPKLIALVVIMSVIVFIALLVLGLSMCGRSKDAPDEAETKQAAREAYMPKLELTDVRVDHIWSDGKSVSGEIRNTGNRIVRKIEITIFYLDEEGRAIFERTHYPVLAPRWETDENKLLKPNYSQKFRYKLDEVPSQWSGEVLVKIVKIAFIFESW